MTSTTRAPETPAGPRGPRRLLSRLALVVLVVVVVFYAAGGWYFSGLIRADSTVPISTSRELAATHPDLVTLEVRRGVEHVRSWNADPGAYDAAIGALLDRR